MFLACICDIAANGKPCGTEWLGTLQDVVAPGNGHVVHYPLVHISFMNTFLQKLQFLTVCLLTCVGLGAHSLWFAHIFSEGHL